MSRDFAGKYIHEKTGSNYLELKPDGNCFLFQGSAGVTGTYEVDGEEITIVSADSTSRARIQDGVIIDTEGDKWVRAKPTIQTTTTALKCPNCNSDLLETAKFCPNCGSVVNAPGKVPPISTDKKVAIAPQGITTWITSDAPLASITWLPAILKRDLPWELIEAIGWVVVLVIVSIAVFTAKP